MRLSVQSLATPEHLRALAAEVDELALAMRPRVPFATSDWLLLWWQHFSEARLLLRDRFFVHTLRDEHGVLVALAPLLLTERPATGPLRLRTLGFWGRDKGITEVRGMLCAPEHEATATQALLAYLLQQPDQWDSFIWDGVKKAGAAHQLLSGTPNFLWQRETASHVLELPRTWNEFRATRSRNIKESLRKCYNSLKRDQLSFDFRVVEDARELPSALERFLQLHAARSRAKALSDHADYFSEAPARRLLHGLTNTPERVPGLRVMELAWGRNTQGQLGDQTTTDRALPVKVLDVDGTPMRGVCSIAAGAGIMIMARAPHCSTYAPGTEPPASITGAWVVGLFPPGTIGGTNAPDFPFNGAIARQFPGLPAGVEIDSIAMPDASASTTAGVLFSMANGSRYAWGNNGASNPLGAGGSTTFAGTATTAVDVSSFWTGSARVEIGRSFALAATTTQSLVGVGRNLEGQLGTGNDFASSTLVPVLNLTNVTDFSVGQVSVVAITNGQLWAWGWDGLAPVLTPGRLGADSGFTHVSRGDEHGLAIGTDQRVYVWGGRSYYALGDGFSSGHAATPALLAE